MKIDIEGSDSLCINDLASTESHPSYVSFECNHQDASDITILASLGYSSFKCVRQNDFRQITPKNLEFHATLAPANHDEPR